jgi:hypothetical protein
VRGGGTGAPGVELTRVRRFSLARASPALLMHVLD